MFMQYPPDPRIAHIVRHYLVLKGRLEQSTVLRLFADGNTGIVFNLGEAALSLSGSRAAQHRSWVYGQLSTYRDLAVSGSFNWIVVVLQPHGACQLWQAAATEWNNSFIPAREVLGQDINKVADRLMQATSLHNATALLDTWIKDLAQHSHPAPALLVQAIRHIQATAGTQSIHHLLQQLQVHERKLERLFAQSIGLSPKQYAGIVRITAGARKIRRLQPAGQLTSIAYDNDYFDQAHFIKDFRKYTGITPWQYRHSVAPLALNLLQC